MREAEKGPISKQARVELGFLQAVRRRCPSYEPVLEALGHLYTRTGLHEESLQIDRELTKICPSRAENWYNLACSYALLSRADEALAALQEAIRRGYSDFEWMQRDKDLDPLRKDPRFLKLVRKARV